jgi:hypothetical protein
VRIGEQPLYELPARRRHPAVDERGRGLRATWHPERGLVNVSLWRGDACVETFRLTPAEASRLIGFLADTLAAGATAAPPALRVAPPPPDRVTVARGQLARTLERAAARLRRTPPPTD